MLPLGILRESIPCPFQLLVASSFQSLPPRSYLSFRVSCVRISFCLPLIRIHVIALRAHLDKLCSSPISRFLITPVKIPFLVCFPYKVHFPVSGIRTGISLGIGRIFVSLPQVSSWQVEKFFNRVNGKKSFEPPVHSLGSLLRALSQAHEPPQLLWGLGNNCSQLPSLENCLLIEDDLFPACSQWLTDSGMQKVSSTAPIRIIKNVNLNMLF